jgi:hypothetical protein
MPQMKGSKRGHSLDLMGEHSFSHSFHLGEVLMEVALVEVVCTLVVGVSVMGGLWWTRKRFFGSLSRTKSLYDVEIPKFTLQAILEVGRVITASDGGSQ